MKALTDEYGWLVDRLPPGGTLISVGCSLAGEAEALAAAGYRMLGIDNDGPTIGAARARYTSRPDAPTLLVGDALRFTPRVPVDVVLVRRPNLVEQPDQWARILLRTASWLKPAGLLALTTPGPAEARVAERMLTAAGYEPTEHSTGAPGEGQLLTASAPATAQRDRPDEPTDRPLAGTNLVVVDLDDEPAPSCDPTTGLCT